MDSNSCALLLRHLVRVHDAPDDGRRRRDGGTAEVDLALGMPHAADEVAVRGGQGALALECRADDDDTRAHLIELHDVLAGREILAERAFLRELGAGCSLPVAAHATARADQVHVSAVMAHRDGVRSVRAERNGDDPEALGTALAAYLRDERGGAALVG